MEGEGIENMESDAPKAYRGRAYGVHTNYDIGSATTLIDPRRLGAVPVAEAARLARKLSGEHPAVSQRMVETKPALSDAERAKLDAELMNFIGGDVADEVNKALEGVEGSYRIVASGFRKKREMKAKGGALETHAPAFSLKAVFAGLPEQHKVLIKGALIDSETVEDFDHRFHPDYANANLLMEAAMLGLFIEGLKIEMMGAEYTVVSFDIDSATVFLCRDDGEIITSTPGTILKLVELE